MKRKTLYGYRLSDESWNQVIDVYTGLRSSLSNFHPTRAEVRAQIKHDKAVGNISKHARPKIFKIVLEDVG